jgi:hypothetical protein
MGGKSRSLGARIEVVERKDRECFSKTSCGQNFSAKAEGERTG